MAKRLCGLVNEHQLDYLIELGCDERLLDYLADVIIGLKSIAQRGFCCGAEMPRTLCYPSPFTAGGISAYWKNSFVSINLFSRPDSNTGLGFPEASEKTWIVFARSPTNYKAFTGVEPKTVVEWLTSRTGIQNKVW